MKCNLPCEIVKDLLPNYIDGLASNCTIEAVEAHLQQCETCKQVYNSMKEENNSSNEQSLQEEKVLLKKISRKVNKKVKRAVFIGIVGIILSVGLVGFLFQKPIREVPLNEVSVSAVVYPLQDIVTEVGQNKQDDLLIKKDESEKEEMLYTINIPNLSEIQVSKGVMDSCQYVSYIEWKSPYLLEIESDIQTVDNKEVMYVRGVKTTLFNNKAQTNITQPTIDFRKIDEIVYVKEDGTENIMWESNVN